MLLDVVILANLWVPRLGQGT